MGKIQVQHEICIHCGLCVMMGFAHIEDGQKYINEDLPKMQYPQAQACCPVGAIQPIEDKEELDI